MKKILCIDDTPDQIVDTSTNKTLKQILVDIFNKSPYEIIFEKNGDKSLEIIKDQKDIGLIFLDILFKGKEQTKQGDQIAKAVQAIRKDLIIITLTDIDERGRKISFGWMPNVIHYVVKRDIVFKDVQTKIENLSRAIIEDYKNNQWEIEYPESGTINLTYKLTQKTYGINIPSSMDNMMKLVIAFPNRPVINPGGSTQGGKGEASLNKVLNTINNKVLEKTDWNTWGILTRENCATGQLKLVIGSVTTSSTKIISKGNYVSQNDFNKFKNEIENRLFSIEQKIKENIM